MCFAFPFNNTLTFFSPSLWPYLLSMLPYYLSTLTPIFVIFEVVVPAWPVGSFLCHPPIGPVPIVWPLEV